jgi:hypothetical protein
MKVLSTIVATTVLGLALGSGAASANDPVYFKSPLKFAGTGCPAGSASVTGEGSDTLSILFDSYDAGKDSTTGKKRVACSFAVPIHVPQGMQVSVLTADWQGFIEGKGELRRKYFFAGNPNVPWEVDTYNKPAGYNFTETDGRLHSSLSFSACGADKIIRINSSIRAKGANSYMAVDTLDLKNKVIFHLQWKTC